jgi:Tol biopolymer transport system component
MSPEQVRGGGVDSRSDLFSLGLVLHEMLSGQRAFTGDSPTEVMSSILRDDPAPLPGSVPPPVAFVISHCLEKEPGQRFQSARDLAASLRALAVASHSAAAVVEPPPRPHRGPWRRGLSGAAVLFALAGAAAAGWFFSRTSLPSFHQVTFQRGFVSAARFAAGGKMLVYSAQWNAGALDLYSAEAAAPESRPFGLHGAHLFSTSVKDELAIGLDIRIEGDNSQSGTLAVVPLNGGAPRPLLQDVAEAAWHPEGNELAVVRATGGVQRLEFPPGKVLHQTGGWLANVRFSPGGDRIAFSEHPFYYDDRGWVATVDLAGNAAVVSQPWESIRGLAWSGGEIWYAASESGLASSIHAARPGGGARVVARFPGGIRVEDVRSDGALLLSTLDDDRAEMFARLAGEARDRPLDWLGPSYPADLSADGKLLLFSQYGRAGGGNYAVYLRKMDGSAPVRLGEGDAAALSPDGQWALAVLYTSPQRLVLLPTGVGSPRTLAAPDLVHQQSARWLPDSRRFLIAAGKPGRAAQLWLHDIGGGAPRAVSPEGVWFEGDAVSPDGQSIAATSPDGVLRLYSLTGGESRDIPGVSAADRFVRWRPGGRSILVSTRGALPIRLFDLDLADGERKAWAELQPADATGITEITQVMVSADGSTIVYGQNRKIRTLYLVQGLR